MSESPHAAPPPNAAHDPRQEGLAALHYLVRHTNYTKDTPKHITIPPSGNGPPVHLHVYEHQGIVYVADAHTPDTKYRITKQGSDMILNIANLNVMTKIPDTWVQVIFETFVQESEDYRELQTQTHELLQTIVRDMTKPRSIDL